MDSCENYSK